MNKLKKAVQLLRDYLGRDKTGIALLDDISNIANELRKQVASISEKELVARRLLEECRGIRTQQETTIGDLKNKVEQKSALLRSQQQKVVSLEHQIQDLKKRLESWMPKDEEVPECTTACGIGKHKECPETVRDVRAYIDTLNALRRQFPKCPVPARVERHKAEPKGDRIYVYELTDIIPNLSSDNLLLLGRFVAVRVLTFGCFSIRAEESFYCPPPGGSKLPEKALRRFTTWFRCNMAGPDYRAPLVSGKMQGPEYM